MASAARALLEALNEGDAERIAGARRALATHVVRFENAGKSRRVDWHGLAEIDKLGGSK